MTPDELYRAGRLREAMKALGDELRKTPLDARRRTFWFELLLFAGEYDRAEKALDVLADGGKDAAAGTLLYRSALHAERTRRDMFARKETPAVTGEVEAAGTCNGVAFTTFEDSDPRIGPNLEVFMAGSYVWIPTAYVKRVEIEPPTGLRDLMWARARVDTTPEFRFQELGEVLIPMLAPLSFQHPEEPVQLGREAAWEPDETYGQIPFGAKLMVVDGEDVPLLNIRTLEFAGRDETPGAEETNDAVA